MTYERWMDGVRAALNEINMALEAWQDIWPFNFRREFDSGVSADDAAMKANKFWWREQRAHDCGWLQRGPTYACGDRIKVEFQAEGAGISEWMWLIVTGCDDANQLVFGMLDSDPLNDYDRQIGLGSELAIAFEQLLRSRLRRPRCVPLRRGSETGRTAMRIGQAKHKYVMPLFPHLVENNVRKGFIEQADFDRLRAVATEPWLRLWLEMAFEYGWRRNELLNLRCRQANTTTGLIRLDVGSTKGGEGREVTMSPTIREMVKLAAAGKTPDDSLLTRADGSRVKDFRKLWRSLTIEAGLGRMVCRACEKTVAVGKKCDCAASALLRGEKLRYVGLIRHDFRRSAARELRRAGVAESTIMAIAGWRTASMFRRYAISDPRDIKAAIEKRQQAREEQSSGMVAQDFAARAEAEEHVKPN